MTTIATADTRSAAPASAIFARWADMATWPDWNLDTEWVRLDGPFVQGATGHLKPKGGPRVRFEVTTLAPEREFVDVSYLIGARLTFAHRVTATEDGGCAVAVEITMSGPLSWVWLRILGAGLRTSVQPDLDRLAHAAERAQAQ